MHQLIILQFWEKALPIFEAILFNLFFCILKNEILFNSININKKFQVFILIKKITNLIMNHIEEILDKFINFLKCIL